MAPAKLTHVAIVAQLALLSQTVLPVSGAGQFSATTAEANLNPRNVTLEYSTISCVAESANLLLVKRAELHALVGSIVTLLRARTVSL